MAIDPTAATLTPNIKQICNIVNSVAKQALGSAAIEVTDSASLVTLGNVVLSSATYTDAFTNVLAQRIARTIIVNRAYRSPYDILALTDFEYGAFVQKIDMELPDAVEDVSVDLADGESVDMYVVARPKIHQKMFSKIGTRTYFVTIQRKWIKMSFLNLGVMGSYIAMIFSKIRNKIEFDDANMGRLCVGNYIANLSGTNREIRLLTNYNTLTGSALTADNCTFDSGFLRYAIRVMNTYSTKMEDISELYNSGDIQKFTPKEYQLSFVEVDFMEALKTSVMYAAFHENYVSRDFTREIPYWQSAQSPRDISLTAETPAGPADKAISNVVAFVYDRDALGTYKHDEDTLTTPVNARGRYYNTYFHIDKMWFNDLTENGVVFTLN